MLTGELKLGLDAGILRMFEQSASDEEAGRLTERNRFV
jgi:hypothetical protein